MYSHFGRDCVNRKTLHNKDQNQIYGGDTPDFECNFKRFKEGIEERKLFLEHQQTVDPRQEHPRLSGDCLGVHILIFNFKF